MKVVKDSQAATLTLVPVEAGEAEVLASMLATLKPEDKLVYGGREKDGEGDKFCKIHLHVGSHKEERTEVRGKITIRCTLNVGGVELVLCGSTEEDKQEVGRIRDTCYFGSGGLIFLGEAEVDGKRVMVTTAKRCKHCQAGMIRHTECEWSTCDACAGKCEHNYVRGAIHGGGTDIGMGEFCDKCGRGKPKTKGEREKSVLEHHLAAVRENVVDELIYKDGPPNTPEEVVNLNRLVRRYAKSKARARA